jgi:hypothetical protein
MYCGKVRTADGRWKKKIATRSASPARALSHGVCPECEPRLVADMRGDVITDLPPQV